MNSRNIYFIRKIAWVSLGDQGVKGMNLGWGDTDFVIHKGAFSNLEFVVRDVDRKPVNLNGKIISASLIDNETGELYIERDLQIIDHSKGRCKLTLTPDDIIDWNNGFIRYSITLKDEDSLEYFYLYNDMNQEAIGYIEVKDKAAPLPVKVNELTEFTPYGNYDVTLPTKMHSGSIKGPGQNSFTSNIMTIAIYFKEFTGKFFVEATLDPVPDGQSANWFKINLLPGQDELKFFNKSGVEPYNISGDYHWIRFGYYQEQFETGSITKILAN